MRNGKKWVKKKNEEIIDMNDMNGWDGWEDLQI